MFCRNFELIPIKIGFFYEFLKVAQKSGQSLSTIVQGISLQKFFIFYNYFYTHINCVYIAYNYIFHFFITHRDQGAFMFMPYINGGPHLL